MDSNFAGDCLYQNPWLDEAKVALLKQLYAEGHSASHIAARIGGTVTRNAVIGKAHRLGLLGTAPLKIKRTMRQRSRSEASSTSRKNSGWKRQKMNNSRTRRIAEIFASEPYIPQPQIVIPEHEQKTLIDLGDHECRFPLNDGNPFKFCAREREKGLPYCKQHARIAFNPSEVRQRAASAQPVSTNASPTKEEVHA